MASIPTNDGAMQIVAMLFSDIEGSTRLARALGASWEATLDRHRSIGRAAFARNGGHEAGTEGDSFFVIFADPVDAVRAAAEFQAGLIEADWPAGERIRVRIGVHAGPATLRDGGYVGIEVHRAARIAAGGHGGQILLSDAARALVGDRIPTGLAIRELGRYRLKDFEGPQTVFQLEGPSLPGNFPPLRLAALDLTNLPSQLTSFVGRDHELAELLHLVSASRFTTLTGVGGTGKTRLMLEAGTQSLRRFPDGVWLVELAALRDPALVVHAVARVLGLQEEPGRNGTDTLTDFLRSKSLLLLLDNCEHLIGSAADLVAHLLPNCPRLSILASSREALSIAGEAVFQVPSLVVSGAAAPDEQEGDTAAWLADVADSPAVRLFIDRATAALPSFALTSDNAPVVLEICRQLDGIPLAIELAAARVTVLSVDEIAGGLGHRFRLLTGGRRTALPRQQTLQALIDWSWDLLVDADRRLFRGLSVFAGGWTLTAAAAVIRGGNDRAPTAEAEDEAVVMDTLDGLSRLVDRSLVMVDPGPTTRYRMLETIRQYGRDRLVDAGETTLLRDRHLRLFVDLAVENEPRLRGPDMIESLTRLDSEIDNLRTALDWALEDDVERALRLCVALSWYWRSRAFGPEAIDRLARAAELALSTAPPSPAAAPEWVILKARVLAAAAEAHAVRGGAILARAWAEHAVALARDTRDPRVLSEAIGARAMVALFSGEFADLAPLVEEASRIADETEDWWTQSMIEAGKALSDVAVGDLAAAEARLTKATDAANRTGDPFAIAFAALSRGRVSGYEGRLDDARHWFGTAIDVYEQMGDGRFVLIAQSDLAHALRQGNAFEEAEVLYRQTLHQWQHLGNRGAIANQLECFAFIAIAKGNAMRAARLLGAAEAMRELAAAPMIPHERAEYDRAVDTLRGQTEPDALDAAWSDGRSLTSDEAVALALSPSAAASLHG